MSEVIEGYIRRHPELSEKDAFEGFLKEERIRTWVGADESRKERLRKEFGRVWGSMNVEGQLATSARSGPSGPTSMQQPRSVRIDVSPAPEARAARPEAPGARRLQVLCTSCRRTTVWMDDAGIQCRSCGHAYEDMLQLIRVTPVGPFEFLFGGGWKGAAVAGGIAAGLLALYLLLRGF